MDQALDQVIEYLSQTSGVNLTAYRRATLHQRLCTRMEQLSVTETGAYLRLVRSDVAEREQLLRVLAVNVTTFFRDPIVFELLAQSVLPEIIAKAARRKSRELRVWSAGCATGEEAYSVAILLHQALRGEAEPCRPLIFATDINGESLGAAVRGLYSRDKLATTQLRVVDQYFSPVRDQFEVHPDIRRAVKFSQEDLTSGDRFCPTESVFGGFDLVLCRNLLIYFNPELQQAVLEKLRRCLNRGGYLVLGQAEFVSGPSADQFRAIDSRNRIFQRT